MREHQFPFDKDADLRREVKVTLERDRIAQEAKEIKARFRSFLKRAGLSYFISLIGIGLYKQIRPDMPWWLLLAMIFSPLSLNYKILHELISRWREHRQAKRQSESWNAVVQDYNQAVKTTRPSNASLHDATH